MTDYVSDAQARSLILDVGRRLYHSGFVASNDGNITFVCLKKIHRYRAWFMPILLQLQHLHALV